MPPYANDERKIILLSLLSILIAVFGVYLTTLPYSFTYDDHHYIEESSYIKSWAGLISILKTGYTHISPEELDLTRPLMPASLALDYSLWGANPTGFRFTNILLHAINSVLVYLLATSLLQLPPISLQSHPHPDPLPDGEGKRWAPLFAAMIFALHPIHVEPVVGVTFREDLLVTLFYLSAMLLYIKFREGSRPLHYIFSLIFFLCALLSKEMAVTFPLVLLLCDHFILRQEEKNTGWFRHIPFWSVTPFYLLFIYSIYSKLPVPLGGGGDMPVMALSVPRMIASYAGLLLLPFNLHVDYDLRLSSLFDTGLPAGLILIVAAGWYLIKGRNRTVAFCIAPFFVTLIPVMNIIPTFRLVADRFLYLPSVWFSVGAGIALSQFMKTQPYPHLNPLPEGEETFYSFSFKERGTVRMGYFQSKIILAVSAILLVILGAATVKRSKVWENDLTLWSDVMKKSPGSVRAYAAVGAYYLKEGRDEEAADRFLKAISLRPDYDKGYYNLGVLYLRKGYYDAAIVNLSKAVELNPDYGKAHFQLGLAFAQTGRYDRAVQAYEKTLKLMPDSAVLHNNLGNAYSETGKYIMAEEAYKTAISLRPDYNDAWYNLGNLYVRMRNFIPAIKAYEKAVMIDPNNAGAFFNMGNVYLSMGIKDKAMLAYRKTLKVNPGHSQATAAIGRMGGLDNR